MTLNKFTPRRYPCPGRCGRLIWHNYPKHTRSYQVTDNRCRKCARRERQETSRLQMRMKRGTAKKLPLDV